MSRLIDGRNVFQQIHSPQRQLAAKQVATSTSQVESKPALTDADRALIEKFTTRLGEVAELLTRPFRPDIDEIAAAVVKELREVDVEIREAQTYARDAFLKQVEGKQFTKLLEKINAATPTVHARGLPHASAHPRSGSHVDGRPVRTSPPVSSARRDAGVRRRESAAGIAESNGHIPPAKQNILNGLAFLHGIGVAPADKTQLALIVGVSPTSGGYFNNLGGLRSEGLIDYPSGGTVALTDAGAAVASTDGVPSTTDELHDAIRAKLPPAKWRILEQLIAVYPDALSKDALAEKIGVSPTSGGYFNNLGSLRSLGLIDYPQPGTAAALPVLFLEP